MSSTNHTPNLGLSQWVLSDPFRMEDFNADNAKIDAAVAAVPYVKLMDVTTTADAAQVDLDVSGIDFTKYAMVQIFGTIFTDRWDSSSNTSYYTYMKINNGGGYCCASQYNANYTQQSYVAQSRRTGYPQSLRADLSGFQPHAAKQGTDYDIPLVIRSTGGSAGWCDSLYCQKPMTGSTSIRTFNFLPDSSSYKVKSGSRFTVYGVRL